MKFEVFLPLVLLCVSGSVGVGNVVSGGGEMVAVEQQKMTPNDKDVVVAATAGPVLSQLGRHITIETIKPGDEENFAQQGDQVIVHYTGFLAESLGGREFDSSRGHDPLQFGAGLGEVIDGMDEAVLSMSLGQRAKIYVPSAYAYGEKGKGDSPSTGIPPNADLVFDLELLNIIDSAENCIGSKENCAAQPPKGSRLKVFSTEAWPENMKASDIPIDYFRHQQKQNSIGWQSNIEEVGSSTLKDLIKSEPVVLVLFLTVWIDPWKAFEEAAPELERLKIRFVQIDASKFRGFARLLRVPRVPHLFIFRNGIKYPYQGPLHDAKGVVKYVKDHLDPLWVAPPPPLTTLTFPVEKNNVETKRESVRKWLNSPEANLAIVLVTASEKADVDEKLNNLGRSCDACAHLGEQMSLAANELHVMAGVEEELEAKAQQKKKRKGKKKKKMEPFIDHHKAVTVAKIDAVSNPNGAVEFARWAASAGADIRKSSKDKAFVVTDDGSNADEIWESMSVFELQIPSIVMVHRGRIGQYANSIIQGFDAVGLVDNIMNLIQAVDVATSTLPIISVEKASHACRNSTHPAVFAYVSSPETKVPSALSSAFYSLAESDWMTNGMKVGLIGPTDLPQWDEAEKLVANKDEDDVLLCGSASIIEGIQNRIVSFTSYYFSSHGPGAREASRKDRGKILRQSVPFILRNHLKEWVLQRQKPLVGWLHSWNRRLYYNLPPFPAFTDYIFSENNEKRVTLDTSALLVAGYRVDFSNTGPKLRRKDKFSLSFSESLHWRDRIHLVAKEIRNFGITQKQLDFVIVHENLEIERGQPIRDFGFSDLDYEWDHEVQVVIFEGLHFQHRPIVAYPLLDRIAVEEDFEDALRSHVQNYLAGKLKPFRRSKAFVVNNELVNQKKSIQGMQSKRLDLRNEVRAKLGLKKKWLNEKNPDSRRFIPINGQVVQLTGKSFQEIVFNPEQDVLVKLQAAYCNHSLDCKMFDKFTYSTLAEKMIAEEKLVIATMNIAENDAPVQFSSTCPELFPTIYFVKAKRNPDGSGSTLSLAENQFLLHGQIVVKFSGELSLKNLLRFLKKEMTVPMVYKQKKRKENISNGKKKLKFSKGEKKEKKVVKEKNPILSADDLKRPWEDVSKKVYKVALENLAKREAEEKRQRSKKEKERTNSLATEEKSDQSLDSSRLKEAFSSIPKNAKAKKKHQHFDRLKEAFSTLTKNVETKKKHRHFDRLKEAFSTIPKNVETKKKHRHFDRLKDAFSTLPKNVETKKKHRHFDRLKDAFSTLPKNVETKKKHRHFDRLKDAFSTLPKNVETKKKHRHFDRLKDAFSTLPKNVETKKKHRHFDRLKDAFQKEVRKGETLSDRRGTSRKPKQSGVEEGKPFVSNVSQRKGAFQIVETQKEL
eukprot:g5337.t1